MAPQNGRSLHARGVQEVFEELRASGKSNEEIFVAVYQDLKRLARKMLGREPAGNSMNASRLLSDLWMRQFGESTAEFDWKDGAHFFNGTAKAMRQLLISHARQRRALFRGKGDVGSLQGLMEAGLDPVQDPQDTKNKNWLQQKADLALALEESFHRLEADAPRLATIVELRVYGGLSELETAEALGLGIDTVTKDFTRAKRRLAYYLKTTRKSFPAS